MARSDRAPDLDCDLLVVGGGAAGLAGAVTAAHHGLTVVVAEKAPVLGGATSWSGGWMWAPLNPLSQADGIVEDIDAPRTYLRHALGENYDAARVEALLENARHMVAFFENHTAVQFVSGTWIADIQGDLPGAGTGGRSVGPKPINLRRVSKDLRPKLRRQLYETSFLGLGIMAGPDLQAFLHATTSVKGFFHAGWRVGLHLLDLVTHRQGMQLVNGTALIARLAMSADDLGVRFLLNAPATRLLAEEGAVTGAVLAGPEGEVTVRARRGVLLAAGGFPHDVDRRRELFPRTPTGKEHWTLAPPETTGDGISLGQSVSGVFDTSLASPAAWCPVSLVPYRSGRVGTYPHIVDRGKPGLIAVLSDGKRFVNEADGYYQFTTAMIDSVPDGQEVAAWLICDHAFQRRYPFGMSKPFPVPVWPYLRSGYLKRGRTLADLARNCGIDPVGLTATVASFNTHAARGEDPQFGRGVSAFNRGSGDPEHQPNPSLAPLEKGPFYAIKVLPGSFGTFAGLKTDPASRVLDREGKPIAGLYAAGSDQANVMGGHYPSGGINIGPAMTFGYIAGRHAAGVTGYENVTPVPLNDGN
ncbi:MAG TPA: FAD-dependent oxidoreductase [Dermatophilaceae bacterium]|nr:FAD-dependent oxidoreductase [Dermatophilaceae bacterium]